VEWQCTEQELLPSLLLLLFGVAVAHAAKKTEKKN
jgi:hypothetical protein